MSVHYWGEEGYDWKGIGDAAAYIGEGLKKWGRVNVYQYKEKYGGVRVYCSLGLSSFEQLTRPGWYHSHWPIWARDLFEFSRLAKALLHVLNLVIVPYHKWLYRRLYGIAAERWPHLHDEILDAAEWPELLERL